MKAIQSLHVSAALAGLLVSAEADAQQRTVGGARVTFPSHSNHFSWDHGFHGNVFIVEREARVIIERAAPPPPAAVPLPAQAKGGAAMPPRKPYVVGGTYASLPPQGCMKMIEGGAAYYFCSGEEWYRQLGDGRRARYRAVARP